MILVQGSCIVNESALTGESIPVIKNCIQSDDMIFDSLEANKCNYINQGTYCMEVKNK
jgi:magnesium-transporting ATPase (P-type)